MSVYNYNGYICMRARARARVCVCVCVYIYSLLISDRIKN